MRYYRYVGPEKLRSLPHAADTVDVTTVEVLGRWLAGREPGERMAPLTYVVTFDGVLRVAPRQREHVSCAQGRDVLAAGEIQFQPDAAGWTVAQVSNRSTGYCPDLDSWAAVAAALDQAGVDHPDGFTQPVILRACPACCAINIVRDDDFTCAICGEVLPER